MKTVVTYIFVAASFGICAQHDHSHEQKPSNAREIWGNFEAGEHIKIRETDWQKTPIAKKIMKKGMLKSEYAYVDSIDVYSMVYESDSLMVTGFMVRPKEPGSYPCVIYNRGGNRDFGQLLVGTAVVQMGMIAAEGYVVIASNYRGNSNSEGKEEFGGSDVNDVLNLIPALAQVESADTSRIGMFGISRGGMMSYMALKETCSIDALVVLGGLNDLFIMKDQRPDMESHVYEVLIPNYSEESEQELKNRSATHWAGDMCASTPILMLHGSKDDACDISMAHKLHEELEKNKAPHVFVEFNNDNHGCIKHQAEVAELMSSWFNIYLKNESAFEAETSYKLIK
ncbi:MAG: prolyl oligopeptidase family serine peptidase [bacterium]|nr:prolyl oligopeptidase family serine peptidase [bacterium]